MKYAGLHLVLGVALVGLAFLHPGQQILWMWLAGCFGVLAFAYALRRPALLGKRLDGTLAWWSWILLLPLHLFTLATWHGVRLLSRETASNRISPHLTVGRRLLSHEVPAEIQIVVDLTAEFAEPCSVRAGRQYVSFPILDASIPEVAALHRVIDSLPDVPTYVHCAQGHGRTGLFASAYLARRGICGSHEEAIALLVRQRPGLCLNAGQKAFLQSLAA